MSIRALLGGGGNSADLLLFSQLSADAFRVFTSTTEGGELLDDMLLSAWSCAYLALTPGNSVILSRSVGVGAYLDKVSQTGGASSNAALASTPAMAAVIASTPAMAAVIASAPAMAAVIASAPAMAAVAASAPALNAVLKSNVARAALVTTDGNARLNENKARILATLADTAKFTKVLSGHVQDAASNFGGDLGAWGAILPGPLIVNVLQAGSWNNDGNVAMWRAMQGGPELGRSSQGSRGYVPPSNSLCIGGIAYTEAGDAGIHVDAWRAL